MSKGYIVHPTFPIVIYVTNHFEKLLAHSFFLTFLQGIACLFCPLLSANSNFLYSFWKNLQFILNFFLNFWLHLTHVEAPRPGIELTPQQWQHQILNPLHHQGTPISYSLMRCSYAQGCLHLNQQSHPPHNIRREDKASWLRTSLILVVTKGKNRISSPVFHQRLQGLVLPLERKFFKSRNDHVQIAPSQLNSRSSWNWSSLVAPWVKDLVLSLLWLRSLLWHSFDLGLGTSACRGCCFKKKKSRWNILTESNLFDPVTQRGMKYFSYTLQSRLKKIMVFLLSSACQRTDRPDFLVPNPGPALPGQSHSPLSLTFPHRPWARHCTVCCERDRTEGPCLATTRRNNKAFHFLNEMGKRKKYNARVTWWKTNDERHYRQ